MYTREQLFRDLGKYFQTIGMFLLGLAGALLAHELDKQTHEQDLLIIVIVIIGVILLSLQPILLILNYKKSKKDGQ